MRREAARRQPLPVERARAADVPPDAIRPVRLGARGSASALTAPPVDARVGVRGGHRRDRRRLPDDRARPPALDARRRHRFDDQSARRGRLLQHRRDVDRERRAGARVAAVRPPPRRLRARRGRRRCSSSSGSSDAEARGATIHAEICRLRHVVRCARHQRAASRRPRRVPGDERARWRMPASSRRRSTASTRTAPPRRRTIPSRRWPSSGCSARARTACRSARRSR